MSDEIHKQRKTISPEDFVFEDNTPPPTEGNPFDKIKDVQQAMAREEQRDLTQDFSAGTQPFEIAGNMPPEFRKALQQRMNQVENNKTSEIVDHTKDVLDMPLEGKVISKKPVPDEQVPHQPSSALATILAKIEHFSAYDEVQLPSKSKFYTTIPPIIHVRPMTGAEENILATPRFVKRGKAIDKIFENVIRESIDTSELLTIDRTYLLIFLRGISYTPEYDVEVVCEECDTKFNSMIDLNNMEMEMCPADFGPEKLKGVLPRSGFKYKYRLATGEDEQSITRHRAMRIKEYGDQQEDDTLLYRSALLLESIEMEGVDSITNKQDLLMLLKSLPVQDVNYIRNVINEPPFGVDTNVGLVCPACNAEFEIALPMEANFFFPRKKTEQTQA